MLMCDDCKKQRICWDKNYCEKYERNRELTNEEWFCALSTEEKADAIYDLLIDRQWGSWSWKLNGMVLRDIYEHGNTKSKKAIVEFLKQPHTPQKQDDYPCNVKGCSLETRQSCCGCPEMLEWEKRNRKVK